MAANQEPQPAWSTKLPAPSGQVQLLGYATCVESLMHLVFVKSDGDAVLAPTRLWIVPGGACSCLAKHIGPEPPEVLAEQYQQFLHSSQGAFVSLYQRPEDFGELFVGLRNTEGQRLCDVYCKNSDEGVTNGQPHWSNCGIRRILVSLGVKEIILEYPSLPPKSMSPQVLGGLLAGGSTPGNGSANPRIIVLTS